MNDLYKNVIAQWEKTTELPPQTVGPLTPYYKMVTKRLKVFPWPILVVAGIGLVVVLFVLFGYGIVPLTSLLQRGF